MKRGSMRYWDRQTLQAQDIDYAVYMGIDLVDMYVTKDDIVQIRYNGQYDFIRAGITLAHAKGMKYMIRISEYSFAGDTSLNAWPLFTKDTAAQTRFLDEFTWILTTYPDLDGIEIEESEGNTDDPIVAQEFRTFKNMFLMKEKNIVKSYHLNDGFIWSINSGNSWMSSNFYGGYDYAYIKANKLIDYYFMQTNQFNLQQYIDRVAEIKNVFAGSEIQIGSFFFDYLAGTSCTNSPTCFNQNIIPFIEHLIQQEMIPAAFTFYRYQWYSSSMFPGYEYMGATLADMVKVAFAKMVDVGRKTVRVVQGNGKVEVSRNGLYLATAMKDIPVVVPFSAGDTLRFNAIANVSSTFIKLCDPIVGLCYTEGYQDYTFIVSATSKSQTLDYYFTEDPTPCISTGYVCEQPLNGYEKDNCGNRRLNSNCNPPCIPNWQCEIPLNGYESDDCGNRRLNPVCNPPAPILESIVVIPAIATIGLNEILTLTALAKNNLGASVTGVPIIWSVDPGGIVDINPVQTATYTDGRAQTTVTGLTEGLVTIIASSGSITGQMVLEVNANAVQEPNILLLWLGIAVGVIALIKK